MIKDKLCDWCIWHTDHGESECQSCWFDWIRQGVDEDKWLEFVRQAEVEDG